MHVGFPESMASFYQQAGRAGRSKESSGSISNNNNSSNSSSSSSSISSSSSNNNSNSMKCSNSGISGSSGGVGGSCDSLYDNGRTGDTFSHEVDAVQTEIHSLCIFVALESPLDQYFMNNPEAFFSRGFDRMVIL